MKALERLFMKLLALVRALLLITRHGKTLIEE